MRYVLLLESAYDNGKLCSLSHRAFRLWANSLSYSRKHRTDGYLTPAQVDVLLRLYRLVKRDVDELVDKGGWEKVQTGYLIHDFLEVNPSEAELGSVSEAKSEAGRLGGLRSAASRRSKTEADASKQPSKHPEAHGNKTYMKEQEVELEVELEVDLSPTEHPAERQPEEPEHTSSGARAAAPPSRSIDTDFEAWWQVYPRRENKQGARDSYQRRRKAGRSAEQLLAAATNLADYFDREATEVRFRPHASTFLNQHRDEEWEKGPPVEASPPRRNGKSGPKDVPDSWHTLRGLREQRQARQAASVAALEGA